MTRKLAIVSFVLVFGLIIPGCTWARALLGVFLALALLAALLMGKSTKRDTLFGPCLSVGPCLKIAPCLSVINPDEEPLPNPGDDRSEVRDRLVNEGTLTPDIVKKLEEGKP